MPHRCLATMALVSCLAGVTACEGERDLASADCLPLRVPAQVTLAREAGLYQVGEAKTLVLLAHPRDTTNDGFQGVRLLRTVPGATPLSIARLQQAWGFDTGRGRISAFGTLPGGERFEYAWGSGTTIGRAPWEPASVPNVRTVACGD